MKYNIARLIESLDKGHEVKYLYFWGHHKSKQGTITASCLSQWWVASFVVAGITYASTEHWMMAQKALLFDDQEHYHKVLAVSSPAEAKAIED